MVLNKTQVPGCLIVILIVMLLTQAACISYRKRPTRLYNEVLTTQRTFDAGIVPGYFFDGKHWDTVIKGRVIWAYHLYEMGIIKNIIFSGSAVYSPYFESKIMGLYAQQLGVPAEHILYDTLAEHSTENIFYSYRIAKKNGFKSLALVTDPFQSSMLKGFTRRRFATKIYHLPFMVDTIRKLNHVNPVIDPASAFDKNFKSLVDRESRFQRFRGTLGAFIPWEGNGRKEQPL